jgi:hypothetical protein
MKRFLLSSAIVVALGVSGFFTYQAVADTANPPPASASADPQNAPPGAWADDTPGPGPAFPAPDGLGRGPAPGGRGPGPEWRRRGDDRFSLFAKVPDKKLSPQDVKTIASAILLDHGNHDWSVADIAPQTDKSIDFSFATAHGDVIATFSIDPVTGRVQRIS